MSDAAASDTAREMDEAKQMSESRVAQLEKALNKEKVDLVKVGEASAKLLNLVASLRDMSVSKH